MCCWKYLCSNNLNPTTNSKPISSSSSSPSATVDTAIVSQDNVLSSQTHTSVNYDLASDGQAYSSRLGDRHELTLFQDQGLSHTKESRDNSKPLPRSGLDEDYQHTIKSFLCRPQRIASYNITTTSNFLGVLSLDNFFAVPSVAAKISNFRFYNCDVCFKLVVNASRYALGKALITHTPFNSQLDVDRQLPSSAQTIQQLTSYPHAELDFGASESVTFLVPFCDIIPWNFYTGTEWSEVRLDMINALVGTTAGETATLSVFMWVENLQLSIPYTQGYNDTENDVKSRSLVQPSKEIANAISGSVQNHPLISELSDGIAWAESLAMKAASLFGMSKPMSVTPNTPYTNIPGRGFTQCEGSSEAVSLSLRPSNGVSSYSGLDLCSEDPMNINHFLTRSQIFEVVKWDTSFATDTPIFNQSLMEIIGNSTSFLHGLSDLYHFYRGGLVFRLSVVKNAFYSGRLAIQFYPSGSSAYQGWDANLPSIVWDIQENRELYFSIPYQSYARMVGATLNSSLMGRLVILIVNPLRADPPLAQTLPINVSVMAAADFAFAVPQTKTVIYTQGLADRDAPPPTSLEIAKAATPLLAIKPTDRNTEAIIMGEPTMSMKDLIKRMTYYTSITATGFLMDPHYFGSLGSVSPFDNLSRYFRFARGSRRYMVVLTAMPTNTAGNSPNMIFLNSNLIINSGPVVVSPSVIGAPPRGANFEHRVDARLNSFLEVNVPYFNTTDRIVVGRTSPDEWSAHMNVRFWASYDEIKYPNPPRFDIYVAAGDDFSFSFPCHIPFQV